MHDTTDAETVFENQFQPIGFVKEVTDGIWVPIDLDKMTIAGPSNKTDAIAIVHKNFENPIQSQ